MAVGEILTVDYEGGDEVTPWAVAASLPPRVTIFRAPLAALPAFGARARLALARRADGNFEIAGDANVIDELEEAARAFILAWHYEPLTKPE
jgi:hypothetical protein